MKKLMMVAAVALALVGCDKKAECTKEGRLESLIREEGKLRGVAQGEIDRCVAQALKKFNEESAEKQDEILKQGEAELEKLRRANSGEGRLESLIRKTGKIADAAPSEIEDAVEEALKEYRKRSDRGREELIKEMEKSLELAETAKRVLGS